MITQKLKIKIIAPGKIKEKFLKDGTEEFLKRLKPYVSVSVLELTTIEIKDKNLTSKILEAEGEKILSNIKPFDYVITLELQGIQLSSKDFADKIIKLANNGIQEIVFVIGSSCGLGKNISARADFKLSMSKMTFLHQFARLILLEQIYRAFKIIKGEPYHK